MEVAGSSEVPAERQNSPKGPGISNQEEIVSLDHKRFENPEGHNEVKTKKQRKPKVKKADKPPPAPSSYPLRSKRGDNSELLVGLPDPTRRRRKRTPLPAMLPESTETPDQPGIAEGASGPSEGRTSDSEGEDVVDGEGPEKVKKKGLTKRLVKRVGRFFSKGEKK